MLSQRLKSFVEITTEQADDCEMNQFGAARRAPHDYAPEFMARTAVRSGAGGVAVEKSPFESVGYYT